MRPRVNVCKYYGCNIRITSLSKSGYCRSCVQKGKKYSKKINLKKGLKKEFHSLWQGGKPKCLDCDKILSRREYKRCITCSNKEALNANWQNGKSFELYPIGWNNILKEKIRKRDNYICQNCSMTEEEHLIVHGQVLHVHHIDYNKKNLEESNLLTLCNSCNGRANFNRDYWKSYYQEKLKKQKEECHA